MEPMVNIVLRGAREAATHIARAFDRPDLIKISKKGHNDFVTNIDQETEAIIADSISKTFPTHRIIGEEGGLISGPEDAEFEWVIDPIDGTTNFTRQIPHFCISIACLRNDILEHAIVIDPIRQEEFIASRGQSSKLNDKKIRVSQLELLDGAVIATGGRYPQQDMPGQAGLIQELMSEGCTLRWPGSAALELAYVAAGRLDGLWMKNLKLWDMAAGALLIQEAGGLLGDFDGKLNHLKNGDLVAASPKIFKSLSPLVKQTLRN
ncbi:MAG: inositol monophosphatase [Gammaproteobacteria bacterium]|nr:inositol monophosphatase [Gammaproteobacteria bacterium]